MTAVAACAVGGPPWKLSWAVVAAPSPKHPGLVTPVEAFGEKLCRQAGFHFRRVGRAVVAASWGRGFWAEQDVGSSRLEVVRGSMSSRRSLPSMAYEQSESLGL